MWNCRTSHVMTLQHILPFQKVCDSKDTKPEAFYYQPKASFLVLYFMGPTSWINIYTTTYQCAPGMHSAGLLRWGRGGVQGCEHQIRTYLFCKSKMRWHSSLYLSWCSATENREPRANLLIGPSPERACSVDIVRTTSITSHRDSFFIWKEEDKEWF